MTRAQLIAYVAKRQHDLETDHQLGLQQLAAFANHEATNGGMSYRWILDGTSLLMFEVAPNGRVVRMAS